MWSGVTPIGPPPGSAVGGCWGAVGGPHPPPASDVWATAPFTCSPRSAHLSHSAWAASAVSVAGRVAVQTRSFHCLGWSAAFLVPRGRAAPAAFTQAPQRWCRSASPGPARPLRGPGQGLQVSLLSRGPGGPAPPSLPPGERRAAARSPSIGGLHPHSTGCVGIGWYRPYCRVFHGLNRLSQSFPPHAQAYPTSDTNVASTQEGGDGSPGLPVMQLHAPYTARLRTAFIYDQPIHNRRTQPNTHNMMGDGCNTSTNKTAHNKTSNNPNPLTPHTKTKHKHTCASPNTDLHTSQNPLRGPGFQHYFRFALGAKVIYPPS